MVREQNFTYYLLTERIRALAGNRTISLVSEIGVISASLFLLSMSFPLNRALLWAGLAVLASLFAWYTHKDEVNYESHEHAVRKLRGIVLSTWLVATSWGAVPLFFYDPDNPTLIIIMVCLYTGYVSGAISVTLAYSVSFVTFALGITIPFFARLVYEGDNLSLIIAGLIVFYICMLSYVSLNLQNLFTSNTKSSYKNLELIEQLKQEKANAEKATLAKSRVLASASHDLRQPIHAANLFIDILEPLQQADQGRNVLDKLRQSMQGLNKMLHGLLDISRLDASAVENKPEHIGLNETVSQIIAGQFVERNNVVIQNHLEQGLTVFADPMILQRVIQNLLENAVKYTEIGKIDLSAKTTDQDVVLSISDTGMGIPAEKLDAIFDEFVQLHNPERNRQKGLGLGLSIVKRLCNLANFDIQILSDVGQGTTVELTLKKGVKSSLDSLDEQSINLVGLHVLVIDDEVDILDGMIALLEQWGCHALGAGDKPSADKLIAKQSFTPKVLISDFRLRDNQSGLDVISEYRAEFGPDLVTILITGDTAPERVSLAEKSNSHVIYKPVDGAALQTVIHNALKKRSSTYRSIDKEHKIKSTNS